MTAKYNPIHKYNGMWWFWEETQTERMGPYATRKHAEAELEKYANWLDE